jgi:uncharacterized membrane protein
MTTATNLYGQTLEAPAVARVSITRPFVWLYRGWADLRHQPATSLAYGLLVSLFGALILAFWRHPYLIAASITGFLLVGPLLTTGLCESSRLRGKGETVTFDRSLSALGRNRPALLRFSVELLLIAAAWFGLSTLMLHLMLGSAGPDVFSTIWGGALEQVTAIQAISYMVIGGLLACVVFARSVVTIPLIIDRGANARTAVRTSLRVTLSDLPAMVVWAALIALLVGLGFATFLIGMVVIFPLLGHSTWHAYRDLVR